MKKEIDLEKENLRIVNGKLQTIDGSKVSDRLKHFAEQAHLDENTPIRLMSQHWYKILTAAFEMIRCGFCDTHMNNSTTLISGRNCYICADCVEVCNDMLKEQAEVKTND